MTERRAYTLTDRQTRRDVAAMVANLPLGTRLEIKDETRTHRQNRAIHGLLGQIMKQRPEHRGITMSMEAYKAVFMHALGQEITMLPSLDGKGFVPLGLSTSALSVREFTDLIQFILAWCASEGIHVRYFDDGEGAGGAKNPVRDAA
jgi:hypothetical protein